MPRLAYLYVPACLSALLLLAFFPLILRLNAGGFEGRPAAARARTSTVGWR